LATLLAAHWADRRRLLPWPRRRRSSSSHAAASGGAFCCLLCAVGSLWEEDELVSPRGRLPRPASSDPSSLGNGSLGEAPEEEAGPPHTVRLSSTGEHPG
jgi:hypothetical protein